MVQYKLTETALDGLYLLRSLFQFHEMFVSLSIEGSRQRCGHPFHEFKKWAEFKNFDKIRSNFYLGGGSVYTVKV